MQEIVRLNFWKFDESRRVSQVSVKPKQTTEASEVVNNEPQPPKIIEEMAEQVQPQPEN